MNVKLECCVAWKRLLYVFGVMIVDGGGAVDVESAISNRATIVMAALHTAEWRLS